MDDIQLYDTALTHHLLFIAQSTAAVFLLLRVKLH